MADFQIYAPILKRLEGGFVNDPADKGGATMCGVTLSTYRQYYGSHLTVDDLKHISDVEWCHIMQTGYWDKIKGNQINNQYIAQLCADWCVNSGVKTAVRKIQEVLHLDVDGLVGQKTLAALNGSDWHDIFDKIYLARQNYYNNLVRRNVSYKKFLSGWLRRLEILHY